MTKPDKLSFFATLDKKRELFLKCGVYTKCRKDTRWTKNRAADLPASY
jgi:hypothetical protein